MLSKLSGHFCFRLLLSLVLTVTVVGPSVGLAAVAEPVALSDAARAGNWATVRSLIASGLKVIPAPDEPEVLRFADNNDITVELKPA